MTGAAGGAAVHAITPFERRAILELFERWGDIDGGYRKLAYRGSYEKLVWVSPSTLYRVLAAQGLVLPASLGYATPDDEHQGRGDTIRQARQDGLARARLTRIAYHRNNNQDQP